MGNCFSEEDVAAGGGGGGDDGEFTRQRTKLNKANEFEEFEPSERERPEGDFFEFDDLEVENMEEQQAKEFMAVKPWIGAIKEPETHPDVDKSKPDTSYMIEHVYGYRCQDSRQNVYYNPEGKVCYMTACLGIILDQSSNTQQFFGGGEVENESKQTASDTNSHNNDIMCMNVNTAGGREWAVTGQVGKNPCIFVWNTTTCEKKSRFKLNKNSRAVSACCISSDTKWIAVADKHNDHNIFVFDAQNSGSEPVWTEKGGPDEIFDMCMTKQEGCYNFWSGGKKHMCFWNKDEQKKKKCIFGENAMTNFACTTADDQGNCYAGGSNALIYVWNGNSCKQTHGCHERGFIGSIIWVDG